MGGSITNRLILVISISTALIIGVGMFIDYQLSRTEILERVRVEAEETITSTILDLENLLDGVEGSTLFLGTVLRQRDYSREGLEQLLRDIVENNDDIFGSAIALNPDLVEDPLGFAPYYFHDQGILTRADLAGDIDNYQEKDWFVEPVRAEVPVWVEPYFDRGGGEILMTTYSVPVFRVDESGQRFLYAVVTADVALEELQRYIGRLRLGEHGFGVLMSKEGVILAARDSDNIMRHYLDTSQSAEDRSTWEDMFQAALRGGVRARQTTCDNIPGKCMVRLGSMDSTGWPIGVLYSEDEILEPLHDYQIRTALVSVLTLVIMALAVAVITRRMTAPLSMLASASKEFAKGHFNTPLPSPEGNDEVAQLVRSFHAMQADLTHYVENLEEATASRSRLEGELTAAREIQMAMLPQGGEARDEGQHHSLWAQVRPAKSVGGDLYYFQQSGSRLWLAVGDVSDKGVPAALFMARAISLIQQQGDTPPDEAMAILNNALESGNDNCMFVTLFLGVLDLTSGQLNFASGGHTPPVVLREGSAQALEQDDGPALGLASGLDFPMNSVRLEPGDRLVIYTDGIDEAFNPQGSMFGNERVLTTLEESGQLAPGEAGSAFVNAVDDFAGEAPQSDDITLMMLDYGGDGTTETARHQQQFDLGSQLSTRSGEWLEHLLEQAGTPPDVIMEMVLVQEELVTNVAKYSGLGSDGVVQVSVAIGENTLQLEISDDGDPFDPLTEGQRAELGADIDHARVGGLGVHLVTQLTDSQSYRRENNRNVLTVTQSIITQESQ